MPYLWSNPNQQGATPAQLTAGAHINEINMGPVVTAILEHQRMQQQQQAQYQQQIAQGIQYLSKQYEAGQADDAANSAMYQSKYPGDNPSYEGFQDRVPDYGGTNALKAQSLMEQLGGGSPLEQGLLKQKILAEAALAHQRLMPRGSSSGVSANQEAVQQRFEERQALGDLNQQIKDLNLTGGLTDAHGAHITRDTLDSTEQVHKGTGPGGEYIPEGYYGIGGNKLDTVVPASEFDKAHSAMNRYNEMLQRPSKQSSGGESLPVSEAFSQARAAIAAGADREAVLQRLQDAGYNTDNF